MTRESTAITVADSYNERIDSYIWGNILMSMRKKNSRDSSLSNLLISR